MTIENVCESVCDCRIKTLRVSEKLSLCSTRNILILQIRLLLMALGLIQPLSCS